MSCGYANNMIRASEKCNVLAPHSQYDDNRVNSIDCSLARLPAPATLHYVIIQWCRVMVCNGVFWLFPIDTVFHCLDNMWWKLSDAWNVCALEIKPQHTTMRYNNAHTHIERLRHKEYEWKNIRALNNMRRQRRQWCMFIRMRVCCARNG